MKKRKAPPQTVQQNGCNESQNPSLSQRTLQPQQATTDGFVEGAIIRMKLDNVLTYDSVEFKMGPYLNVVIGPNGTGKSTIVCAICLGLAGKPSVLGRATQVSQFIKYGCNKCVIEIELFNPDGDNWVIQREIHKNNNSSWSVNWRNATQKSVEELVARLNIQVGNLCQFLPQEKVPEFAKMTEIELLENTEKAIGSPEMFESHNKLKEARTEVRHLEQLSTNVAERLEQERQKNARLEQDVKNYEERQRHLQKITILQMKRPWLEYEERRKQFQVEKSARDSMLEEVKKANRVLQPLRDQLDVIKKEKDNYDSQMKSRTESLKDFAKKAKANSDEINSLNDKFVEVQEELVFKQQEENGRKKRLNDLKRQLDTLLHELANIDEQEDHQPALERVNQLSRQVNREQSQIVQQGDTLRLEINNCRRQIDGTQRELRVIQDVERRRLEVLRAKHKHTYDAVLWLQQNQQQFTGTIHPPIMLSVNVKNPAMAKYVESHINFNDMKAFVCENSDDMNQFMNIMRDEQRLKINAIGMPQQPVSSFRPQHPLEHYRKYRFQTYLKDLFTCPEAVMRYLCAQYRVHRIPVGDQYTKDNVESVLRDCPELQTFYTKNHQYNVKKSKYDGSTSSRITFLKPPSLLTVSLDAQREQTLQHQLQELQKQLEEKEETYRIRQQRSHELEVQMNQLREEKKQLMQKKDQKKRLQSQIESKKQSIHNVEGESINLPAEEEKAGKRIQEINIRKCRAVQQLKNNTQKCFQISMEKVRLSLQHAAILKELSTKEAELRDLSHTQQNAERQLEEMKERVKQTKDTAKRLLDLAKKATNTGANEDLSADLRRSFESCPQTIEEIDAAIHEQQARADCTFQTDERVVREFRQRKKDIDNLEKDMEEKGATLENYRAEVEEAKRLWLEPLKELIGKINRNFSFLFKCLNCAGEVSLRTPDNPEDYEKYGVCIKTMFRDSDTLQELTPHRQSGGERSVATVLYLMALQELARCPFRCVDEINQGMDPVNERKVFELVVQTVCKKTNNQYFLFTPKLLPDLEYDKNMTVLCVFNGAYMLNHTEWNLKKFLKRRKKLD